MIWLEDFEFNTALLAISSWLGQWISKSHIKFKVKEETLNYDAIYKWKCK